jgi:hypothetical protein
MKLRAFFFYIIFFVCVASLTSLGQNTDVDYTAIDKEALAIPTEKTKNTQDIANYILANFKTEDEKVRAIFIWTATNFEYDIDNMFAINFNEKQEDKIARVLKTRKGICENYAAVFQDISKKCGLNAHIVVGYTRQNGFTSFIPHGWCAVKVAGKWQLVDPTWGSGYIDKNKFVSKISNEFFKANPTLLIKTHMPFDPVWQLLDHPVSFRQFSDQDVVDKKDKTIFHYNDSIALFEHQTEVERFETEISRIENNGINNAVIYDRLSKIKSFVEVSRKNEVINKQNEIVDIYNSAVTEFNEGTNDLNTFIEYRNKQFTPAKTDAQIKDMLQTAEQKMNRAEATIKSIVGKYDKLDGMIATMDKSMKQANTILNEQKDFLKKYLSKGKVERKFMFVKLTKGG